MRPSSRLILILSMAVCTARADYPACVLDPPGYVDQMEVIVPVGCVLVTQAVYDVDAMTWTSAGFPVWLDPTGQVDPVCGMAELESAGNVDPCPCGGSWPPSDSGEYPDEVSGWCVETAVTECGEQPSDCVEYPDYPGCADAPITPAPVPDTTPEPLPACVVWPGGRVRDNPWDADQCQCVTSGLPPTWCACETLFGITSYEYRTCGGCQSNCAPAEPGDCHQSAKYCAPEGSDCTEFCRGYGFDAGEVTQHACLVVPDSAPLGGNQACSCYQCDGAAPLMGIVDEAMMSSAGCAVLR